MYLLDSDVVIWHLRGRPEIVSLVERLAQEGPLGVSSLTRIEVRAGMRPHEQAVTESFLSSVATYNLSAEVADLAADLVRRHRSQGITLPLVDAGIAATAIAANLVLVTLNPSHYPIPELRLYPMGSKP